MSKCDLCGWPLLGEAELCWDCATFPRDPTDPPEEQGPKKYKGHKDRYTGYYGQSWEDIRQAILERDGYECLYCGLSDEEHRERDDLFPPNGGLHVHHRVKSREFDTYEEANTDQNLVSLCAVHHRQAEAGAIDPLPRATTDLSDL